ncbi:hypothetical protein KO465_00205 [Candidatus Micrarchaeota archaeon]|nr:hypothetical protein [Candidatus Micrarchaeota archaeon]
MMLKVKPRKFASDDKMARAPYKIMQRVSEITEVPIKDFFPLILGFESSAANLFMDAFATYCPEKNTISYFENSMSRPCAHEYMHAVNNIFVPVDQNIIYAENLATTTNEKSFGRKYLGMINCERIWGSILVKFSTLSIAIATGLTVFDKLLNIYEKTGGGFGIVAVGTIAGVATAYSIGCWKIMKNFLKGVAMGVGEIQNHFFRRSYSKALARYGEDGVIATLACRGEKTRERKEYLELFQTAFFTNRICEKLEKKGILTEEGLTDKGKEWVRTHLKNTMQTCPILDEDISVKSRVIVNFQIGNGLAVGYCGENQTQEEYDFITNIILKQDEASEEYQQIN